MRKGDTVEGEIPCGVPRVLPLVWHRDDVHVVQVAPVVVAATPTGVRRGWTGRVTVQPAQDVVVVELLGPEHPAERLAQHERLLRGATGRGQLGIELVGLA